MDESYHDISCETVGLRSASAARPAGTPRAEMVRGAR